MRTREAYALGARVMVYQEGLEPYESRVDGVVGDASKITSTDQNAESYKVADDRCPKEGIPAHRVLRIVRVTIPNGESYEGVRYGAIYDGVNEDAPMTKCSVYRLNTPTIHACVDIGWVTAL